MTRDCTGVGVGSRSSPWRQSTSSVYKPKGFHVIDCAEVFPVVCAIEDALESSGLFRGIRKAGRDCEAAERSELTDDIDRAMVEDDDEDDVDKRMGAPTR